MTSIVASAYTQFSLEEFEEFFEKVYKSTRANVFLKVIEEHRHLSGKKANIKFLYNADIQVDNISAKEIYTVIMGNSNIGSIFDHNPKYQVTKLHRMISATPMTDLYEDINIGITTYCINSIKGWNSYTAQGKKVIMETLNCLKNEENLFTSAIGMPEIYDTILNCSFYCTLEVNPPNPSPTNTFGFYKNLIDEKFYTSISSDIIEEEDKEINTNKARIIGILEDRFSRYVDITGKLSKNTLTIKSK